jgi:SagB-type dehydrogenase family enzyme
MPRRPQLPNNLNAASLGRRRVVMWLVGATTVDPSILRRSTGENFMAFETQETLSLPNPRLKGPLSVEEALSTRRSVREFTDDPLAIEEMAQLLWSAQGITETGPLGLRSAPSAGALYPLEVALLTGAVNGLAAGVYRYLPRPHALRPVREGDMRAALAAAALGQAWIAEAACVLVLAAIYRRTTRRYGRRGERYVHMEVGHTGQNIYLQARALGLGTTMVGAFDDRKVQRLLGLEADEAPLGILPIGRLR